MMDFQLPPKLLKENGEKRRVGFELEFGGLDLPEIASILIKLFGGRISHQNMYCIKVETPAGEYQIEADSNFLKKKKYEKYLQILGLNPADSALGQDIENLVAKLAGTLIPFEIVSPPLPMDQLKDIDLIRQELLEHSAKGTRSAIFMAFGMQFNPELPDFKVETWLNNLRAFFLLFDWLFEEADIPVSRRVAPFIHDFPDEYINLVLDTDYQPDLKNFMRDYLVWNPTRNRPLDLLPLFAHVDPELVFSYPVEVELVKPRPTFHYRLPNSQVDNPQWTVAEDWNKWVEVEKLAENPLRIRQMTEDYFSSRGQNLIFVRSRWAAKTRTWLHA